MPIEFGDLTTGSDDDGERRAGHARRSGSEQRRLRETGWTGLNYTIPDGVVATRPKAAFLRLWQVVAAGRADIAANATLPMRTAADGGSGTLRG